MIRSTGPAIASGRNDADNSEKPSAFENVPRAMVRKCVVG